VSALQSRLEVEEKKNRDNFIDDFRLPNRVQPD
jgi:hypothetical protein